MSARAQLNPRNPHGTTVLTLAVFAALAASSCKGSSDPGCSPVAEVCDGVDNDCDGSIDEGFALGVSCTVGLGICEATGLSVCSADHLGSDCDATPGSPASEACDGLDNDCDGAIDEEGAGGCSDLFADADGDGFGAGPAACLCPAAPGFVAQTGDCDPGNPGVNPAATEICGDLIDSDCDGAVDPPDYDGDSWTRCTGDCCETLAECSVPAAVNPGALEAAGNGVDDDCDGTLDNPAASTCSGSGKLTAVTAYDAASAMDLCQTTTLNPPLAQKKWGLISAGLLLVNGTAGGTELSNSQTAVMTHFGTGGVAPRQGATMAGLSSGNMRDAADPGWVLPMSGTSFPSAITFPGSGPIATYTNAHGGGLLAGHCGAATCATGTGAYDSVMLRLVIRAPTNAQGLSYDFRFFSSEYQTYQCTVYNDYYLAMLTSGAAGIPADHNISFDSLNNPVSVNNGFFQVCAPNGMNCGTCPSGTSALAGTGFDQVSGGATEWLTTDAPVVPGEVMTLEFLLFDVSDHIGDSDVLLDNFRWSLTPVSVGTHN